jgi:hypothetical protein
MSPISWPTVSQIVMASERPILATLDAALEMTARTLLAEHAMLEEDASRGAAEPLPRATVPRVRRSSALSPGTARAPELRGQRAAVGRARLRPSTIRSPRR